MQEARGINPQRIRTKETTAPADIFDRLISQPGARIWNITDEGGGLISALSID